MVFGSTYFVPHVSKDLGVVCASPMKNSKSWPDRRLPQGVIESESRTFPHTKGSSPNNRRYAISSLVRLPTLFQTALTGPPEAVSPATRPFPYLSTSVCFLWLPRATTTRRCPPPKTMLQFKSSSHRMICAPTPVGRVFVRTEERIQFPQFACTTKHNQLWSQEGRT
jgi:hypothetical protein